MAEIKHIFEACWIENYNAVISKHLELLESDWNLTMGLCSTVFSLAIFCLCVHATPISKRITSSRTCSASFCAFFLLLFPPFLFKTVKLLQCNCSCHLCPQLIKQFTLREAFISHFHYYYFRSCKDIYFMSPEGCNRETRY